MTVQEEKAAEKGSGASFRLTIDTYMPELLRRYPQARRVLDRYGLRGCGGRDGPHESLRFFARAHGVDGGRLMEDLHAAVAGTAHHQMGGFESEEGSVADTIYRPFFLGGIAVVLSIGAAWGVWLLWRIGFGDSFASVSMLEINAHGHAMIFGWVGLFIMGFALQAFPRMWHVPLPWAKGAVASFAVMVGGILVRTLAMAAAGTWWAAGVALAGGVLELMAILVVCGILLKAFINKQAKSEPYMAFVLAALGWFVAQAVYGLWHIWMTMTAASWEALIHQVSTYQAPLRDMQVHGLALFMILGVSMRIFPALFGLPRVSERRAWIGLGLLITAVLGEIGCFLAFRLTDGHGWAIGLYGAWVLLACGVVTVAWPWKLWRRAQSRDRSIKFIRTAYGWLAISLVMLLALPLYQQALGTPFSHAYYGAIRHAVTVGFISMMIMGVAAKVAPTLRGRDPHTLSRMWGPFVLINLGCFLRVSLQSLTDWFPWAYTYIGLSGSLEITALAWWGAQMAGVMLVNLGDEAARGEAPPQISADHRVGDVLAWFPGTAAVFAQFGFTPLKSAVLRKAVAGRVTIRQAASVRGVELGELMASLYTAAHGAAQQCAACGQCEPCDEQCQKEARQ